MSFNEAAFIESRPAPRRGGRGTGPLHDWVRALEATAAIARNPRRIFPLVVEEQAQARGDAPALLSAHESFTYRQLAERSNRYARWALAQNLAKGDVVCLAMPNRPEYMAIWLGLTSIGVVVALLNTHLRDASLAHCIDIVAPKHVIVAAELLDDAQAVAGSLASRPRIWAHGGVHGGAHGGTNGSGELPRIDTAVEEFSGLPLTRPERRVVTVADRALLIYTSGTTGLPKAANVSHRRLLQWSFWFASLMNTTPDDRMYDCLPMYHSVGGVVAPGALLVHGGSVVLREKFSAGAFWDDIRAFDCTLFQYIGELCRYLVNAPERPRERAHRLRLACGNGLRAEVWEKFQARFGVPRILEFYAATESNVSLYNVEGKPGAVGRVPAFLAHRFPLALVRFDAEAGAPSRGADGLCTRCATSETGEALGRIHDGAAHAGGAFEGYTDAEATERKIVRDVFVRGDAWYRTGDLMRMDRGGFYHFVDRIGDTFRWKGENVATAEVAAAIAEFPDVRDVAVYGVPVAGTEGAAGMAALVADATLDLQALRAHLVRRLPDYAQPRFLRLMERIALTATFKHQKNELAREGFDPGIVLDPLFFNDPERQAFVPLDETLHARIAAGEIKL